MADFVKAARTTEIEPDQARLVEVKSKQIALFNVNSQLFALDNTPALTAAGLSLMERYWGTK